MQTNKQTNTTTRTESFRILQAPFIPGLPKISPGPELLADNSIVKPRELVDGLIHQGTKGVLASGSKVGKTWLLMDLGLSVATGTRFLHWRTAQGRVLFINFEIPTAFMKERLTALMRSRGLTESGGLDFWNLRGKTTNPEALLANIIKETDGKGYVLIILDPIYKVMGKSENTSAGVGALCQLIERLAEKTGAAIVYSHHFPKGNVKKKSAIDRMSGSGVFGRDADTIIVMTEHTEPECFTVEMILRNFGQQPSFVVEWDYPLMVERPDLDPEDITIEEVGEEEDHGLLQIVKVRPHTTAEWLMKAGALGLSRATFFRIKRKLKENGYIYFDFGSKMWTAVEEPTKVTTTAIMDSVATGETDETDETDETGASAEGGKG